MSSDKPDFDIDDEINSVMARRERRITIRLHKQLLRQKSNSSSGSEFLAHKSAPPIFEAGDEISGFVGLEVNGGQPVSKIRLAVVCLSQVRWQVHQKHRKSVINLITGDERANGKENQIYFDRKLILQLDLGKNSDNSKWPNGKYELPFRVTLPDEGLASTVNSCHGFIKYTIEVFTVDEDQAESRGEKEIVVVAPIHEKLDLHGRSLEKSIHVMGSGKITINGALERKEYVVGELVPVEVTIVNDSNVAVQPRVSLFQTQTFVANQVNRTLETCLTSEPYTAPAVPATQSATQIIKVPLSNNLVVSLRSALISVKYHIHIGLDLPHAMDLNINLPFVVTTKRALNGAGAKVIHGRHQYHTQHSNNGTLDSQQQQFHSAACQQQQTHPNVNGKNRAKVNNV